MSGDTRRVVLRGGTIVDGSGGRARRGDVLVLDDRIHAVGTIDAHPADEVIDCADRLVLPGFIDAHSHADAAVFDPDVQHALLRQGITTVVGGQDGVSFAPGDGVWASRYFAAINGTHPGYAGGGIADLLAAYDGAIALNAAYLVPAGTVRHEVMGLASRPADADEIERMQRLVAAGMHDGALGLSTGLDYVPGLFADADELARLCEPVASAGGIYVTHMRGGYETHTAAGLREVAEICARSGVSGHVSHLHVDAAEAERLLAELSAEGLDLTFDMYPYTRGCTLVSMALLPPEYSAMEVDDAVAALEDPAVRARLSAEWFPQIADKPSLGPGWPTMVRVGHTPAPDWAWAPGLTLAEIAAHRGSSVADATLDLLVAGRLEVNAVMAVRDERSVENLGRLFSHPGHTGGSDGIFVGAVPHPRAYGAFARYLGTHVGAGLTWESAARHLAGRTAERFGLLDRGRVSPGYTADIIMVDPASVRDSATYDSPRELATGIDDVLVGGQRVLAGGVPTGALAGRGLRRTGAGR